MTLGLRVTGIAAVVASIIAGSAHGETNHGKTRSKDRIFAYMHTKNKDGTKERTHVFALTEAGTLAERVTSQLDTWRMPERSNAKPYRFTSALKFATVEERNKRVAHLYNSIVEFEQLATTYFERDGKAVPPDHLFEMKEQFGPHSSKENIDNPSQAELNQLHVSFALFHGVGSSTVSKIWGNWTENLHSEMVSWLGCTHDKIRHHQFNNKDESAILKNSLVIRMHRLLSTINFAIHDVEAFGPWALQNHFSFNTVTLGGPEESQPFLEEDYEPDRWRLAQEMGGLYLSYATTGKNFLNAMQDNDLRALKPDVGENRSQFLQFQDSFNKKLYVVWSLANETEANKRQQFQDWWKDNEITERFGYVFGQRDQPNGFIRLGQQVCDPASDCDRPWHELINEFAETPEVHDIYFADTRPYGDTDEDLRFLYPGDDAITKSARDRNWHKLQCGGAADGTGGVLLDPEKEGCCGGKAYQYDTEGCYNHSHVFLYELEGCCGANADGTGGIIHTWKEEGCCGGKVYKYSKELCDGDGESGTLASAGVSKLNCPFD